MKVKKKTFLVIGVFLLVVGAGFKVTSFAVSRPGQYDDFAQCLTDNGATFYGAYWCPNCVEQKKMFGDSVYKIDYVECSLPNRGGQTQECIQAGITGYPTWEFGDGTRASGALPLEILSIRSGCTL